MEKKSKLATQFWWIFFVVLFFDQLTKKIFFSVQQNNFNTGVAWGVGSKANVSFWVHGFVMVFLIFLLINTNFWKKNYFSWGLIIGGGFSNYLDRIIFAGIRDFLPLPIFTITNNFADWAIFFGAIYLIKVEIWK